MKMLIISRTHGKIAERPIVKRLKDKICFFFLKTNYYLLRWIMLLAGFASISACSLVPWGLVSPKGGRYEWFYDKADPVSDEPFSTVLSRGNNPKVQSDWIIWMNICCQVCSESFIFVRLLRHGAALHLQNVSLLCLTLAGWTKQGVYVIISVKGLLVFFCNHMKRVKMSPIIQPV